MKNETGWEITVALGGRWSVRSRELGGLRLGREAILIRGQDDKILRDGEAILK